MLLFTHPLPPSGRHARTHAFNHSTLPGVSPGGCRMWCCVCTRTTTFTSASPARAPHRTSFCFPRKAMRDTNRSCCSQLEEIFPKPISMGVRIRRSFFRSFGQKCSQKSTNPWPAFTSTTRKRHSRNCMSIWEYVCECTDGRQSNLFKYAICMGTRMDTRSLKTACLLFVSHAD